MKVQLQSEGASKTPFHQSINRYNKNRKYLRSRHRMRSIGDSRDPTLNWAMEGKNPAAVSLTSLVQRFLPLFLKRALVRTIKTRLYSRMAQSRG
jgi:hypothetical protein